MTKKRAEQECTLVVRNLSLPYTAKAEEALRIAEKKLRFAGIRPVSLSVFKRSVDARRKNDIRFLYSVSARCLEAPDEKVLQKISAVILPQTQQCPPSGSEELSGRVVVVGFGPCGMFAALELAKAGYRPLVLERGSDVLTRKEKVDRFMETGILDADSNIQFGAGGAGTFSDGKLVTRVNDPLGATVFETLCDLGAPESIMTLAKPHVGTDKLLGVVSMADKRIRALGGEILYNTKLLSLRRKSNGTLHSVLTSKGEIPCGALILAVGHSARDTYEMLLEEGVEIIPKDFSVGARVEHLQKDIDEALYGEGDVGILGHGEYSLSYREGNRGVYSFCMCPGGQVVCASSEEGGLVVNGMSNYARDGRNANAAIAVSILKEDYGATPQKAIDYQRRIERTAFVAAGGEYRAPIQLLGDFLAERKGGEPGRITPTFRDGKFLTVCDLATVLPPHVTRMMRKGFPHFEKQIKGYAASDAVLTGVETRTSSPVRIVRKEDYTAGGCSNLYPAGEGAGYAGGITSAAIDGLRVARKVVERYKAER